MRNAKVYLGKIENDKPSRLNDGFDYLGLSGNIKDKKIFIKPNLTYPSYKPGVTTSPVVLEELIKYLKDYTNNIIIGESDGGYNAYSVDEAFEKHNILNIGKRYNLKVINLSKEPFIFLKVPCKNKSDLKIEFPIILRDEVDYFITMPVPKMHAMTKISLSIKNQWGCVPNIMRLKYHPYFNEAIKVINDNIKNKITLIDGTYGLTDNGPMVGKSFKFGIYILSDNILAADLICSNIMKQDLSRIKHYELYFNEKRISNLEEIETNIPYKDFISNKFYLKRNIWNYVALSAWKINFLNYLFYYSPLSDLLHKIMYTFREKPVSSEQ